MQLQAELSICMVNPLVLAFARVNPITHGLIGWSTANLVPGLSRRDLAFIVAWARGTSPLGLVSERADSVFVKALRNRFPR